MNKRAFIFPGQGSQKVGMLDVFTKYHPKIKPLFETANEICGVDLWQMVNEGSADTLNQTVNTQPALLTASIALWECFAAEMKPDFLAGHSLGEYSALVAAGAIKFEDAVALVKFRGELMQKAIPAGEGSMAAILGLNDDAVDKICQETNGVVAAANYNSPGQVVISGSVDAVKLAAEQCKEQGAKRVLALPVSIPSHCPLMQSAADELAVALDDIEMQRPEIPVVQNVNAQIAESVSEIKKLLVAQLYSPVKWTQDIHYLISQGVSEFIECGPGKVLSGLGKRISREVEFKSIGFLLEKE